MPSDRIDYTTGRMGNSEGLLTLSVTSRTVISRVR